MLVNVNCLQKEAATEEIGRSQFRSQGTMPIHGKEGGHLMPKPSGYPLQVQHLMSDFSSVYKYKNDR